MRENNSLPSEEQKFLIALTRIGYQCGASLNRLNATLQQLGSRFGLSVDMSGNGSRAHMIFGPGSGEEAGTGQYSYFLKLPEPMPELNKLVAVQELVDDVATGRTRPAEGLMPLWAHGKYVG